MSFGTRKNQTPVRAESVRAEPVGAQAPVPADELIEVDFFTRIQGFIVPAIVFVGMIVLVMTSPIYGMSGTVSGLFGGGSAAAPKCYSFAGGLPIESKNEYFVAGNHSFWGMKGKVADYDRALENVEEAVRTCTLDYCPKPERKIFARSVYKFAEKRAWLYQVYFNEYGEPGLAYLKTRYGGFRDKRILTSIRERYKGLRIRSRRRGGVATAVDMLVKGEASQFGPCRTS